ncbi:MAG TPA: tetratricopeptide repeat protein [Vicinamibacterales bacterium]|nr:tetratricopeptide repeat protein [Vicinamibacterales bacterium]
MKTRPPAVIAALAALGFLVACSSSNPDSSDRPVQAGSPKTHALRQVSLPDVTGMSPSVQQQLRHQAGEVTRLAAGNAPADQRATAFGEMGKLLLAVESFGDAEACFLNASELNPSDSRWAYYLGHVYRAQGESQEAAAYFERALKARPEEVAALVWLGNMYLDQGRTMEAGPLFSQALALDATAAAAHVGLGRVSLAARDYTGAIEHLEAALMLNRGASSVHYLLASAYRGAGQVDRADAHVRQRGPVQIGPPDPLMQQVADLLRSPVTYESRGERALARGDFSRATVEFRAALELAPESLAVRQKLATALSLTGDVQGSVQQLQEILRRDPKFASAHYSLGVLLQANGETNRAIEEFASAVRYEPTYVQARLLLANTLRSRGQFDRAREQYVAVLGVDPRIAEARFGDAASLAALKRFTEARDRLAEGMRLHPDRVEFMSLLARLYAAAPDERVRDGNRALTLAMELTKRRDSAFARETLAMAFAEAGRYDEAVTAQREAVALADGARQWELAARMRANLRLFERRQPSRTPWVGSPIWEP